MSRRVSLHGLVLPTSLGLFLTACGGGMSSTPGTSGNPPAPSLVSIAVSPSSQSLQVNGTAQFGARAKYSDGSFNDVTNVANWSSSDPSIATVQQGKVSAATAGSAAITASFDNKSGSSIVKVTAPPGVVALQITPANSVVPLSWTGHLTATAIYSDGTTANVSSHVTWSDVNGVIAIVHGTLFNWYVANPGSTVITAWYPGPDNKSGAYSATTMTAGSPSPLFAFVADAGDNTLAELSVDESSGQMKMLSKVPVGQNPSAVAVEVLNDTIQEGFVYVANHDSNDLSAFSFDHTSGKLTPVPGSPIAVGPHPSSLAMGYWAPHLFVTNDDGLSEYLIDNGNGALQSAPGSPYPTGGQPTSVTAFNSGWEAYATNSGGNIAGYYFLADTTEALQAMPGSPFPSGLDPVALAFSPSGQLVYAADSAANLLSTYATSFSFLGGSPAFLALVPLSQTMSIASPSALATVQTPGTFNQFLYAASSSTNTVTGKSIQKDGSLRSVSGSPFMTGDSPQAAVCEPTGQFLYVVNSGGGSISAFRVNPATGTLSPLAAILGFVKPTALALSRQIP